MHEQTKSGAGKGAALDVVLNTESRLPEPKKQGEFEVFEEFRRTYRLLESDPDDPYHRIAFLKARRAWCLLNHGGAHAALQ